MGDVYLAHDLLLERQVAIKFVSNQKTDDPTLARRLLKEAKGVAAIEHPNICPVFDAGTDEAGRPFIVMQYLEGQTLSEKLAGGPLSIKKAFEMCAQIADALAAAHEVGIVHRDLKPANIVLTSAGQPKVLDFGIAKFLPSSQFVSERETQTGLTQPLYVRRDTRVHVARADSGRRDRWTKRSVRARRRPVRIADRAAGVPGNAGDRDPE